MCFKNNESREQLRRIKNFLNKNRMWICLDDCINAPECSYCNLIYQINYSYKSNKHATVETFENSVLSTTFSTLEDIYREHKTRTRWQNYNKCFIKKRQKIIYRVSFL